MRRLLAALLLLPGLALAGAQRYEALADSVRARMQRAIADRAVPRLAFADPMEGQVWMRAMSRRMERFVADPSVREELLATVHYEATRAGLDPELVLALIEVESRFRKYAVSKAGARGYMQVMPFWMDLVGERDQNLFALRTNLRYGCIILRHYLDVEQGNLYRALGRYNGSLGRPEYPNMVRAAWKTRWQLDAAPVPVQASRN
jgi:soluble lytic murein transglycosylase-like protein